MDEVEVVYLFSSIIALKGNMITLLFIYFLLLHLQAASHGRTIRRKYFIGTFSI